MRHVGIRIEPLHIGMNLHVHKFQICSSFWLNGRFVFVIGKDEWSQILLVSFDSLFAFCDAGHDRDPRGPMAARNGAPPKVLPIEIPAISISELNRLTNNFSDKALVGEGSYGRVFRVTLNTGEPAAIKKLDPSASNEPDTDFAAQVSVISALTSTRSIHVSADIFIFLMQLSMVSRLKNEFFVELLGYCLDANHRILVYQFATKGSLHDVLHGKCY